MPERIIDSIARYLLSTEAQQVLGQESFSQSLGKTFSVIYNDPELARTLEEFPGEISREERCFLYNFVSTVWDGQSNILEIGPFLGSSTRALAHGMLANQKKQDGARLETFDRFGEYYKPQRLLDTLAPQIELGKLPSGILAALRSDSAESLPDFLDIFTALHCQEPYWELLETRKRTLPFTPNAEIPEDDLFSLKGVSPYQILFIDACKSWFSTKYFMQEASLCSQPGSFFILQDYGWKSCFWLPCFMSIFQNSFRLIANVQTTYVFQLSKALNAQEIEKHFPDCPTDFSAKDFHRIFENVEIQNSHRSDLFALVAARLQHVAALAYIGEKEAAREILSKLASQPFTKREPFIRWITQSTHNPTYFPDGTPIILD